MPHNKSNIKLTDDKLIDLLMHSATREDIAQLRTEVNAKIDSNNAKIDSTAKDLNAKIDKILYLIITILISGVGFGFWLADKLPS